MARQSKTSSKGSKAGSKATSLKAQTKECTRLRNAFYKLCDDVHQQKNPYTDTHTRTHTRTPTHAGSTYEPYGKVQSLLQDALNLSRHILQEFGKTDPLSSTFYDADEKMAELFEFMQGDFGENGRLSQQAGVSFIVSYDDAMRFMTGLVAAEESMLPVDALENPLRNQIYDEGDEGDEDEQDDEQDDAQDDAQDDEQDEQDENDAFDDEEEEDFDPFADTYDENRDLLVGDLTSCRETLRDTQRKYEAARAALPRLEAACHDPARWRSLLEKEWRSILAKINEKDAEENKNKRGELPVFDNNADDLADALYNLCLETLTLLLLPTTETLLHNELSNRIFADDGSLDFLPSPAEYQDAADDLIDDDAADGIAEQREGEAVEHDDDTQHANDLEIEQDDDDAQDVQDVQDVRDVDDDQPAPQRTPKQTLDLATAIHSVVESTWPALKQELETYCSQQENNGSEAAEDARQEYKQLEKTYASLTVRYHGIQSFLKMFDAAQHDAVAWRTAAQEHWNLARSSGSSFTLPNALYDLQHTSQSIYDGLGKIKPNDVILDDTFALDTLQDLLDDAAPVLKKYGLAWRTRSMLDLVRQGRIQNTIHTLKEQRRQNAR